MWILLFCSKYTPAVVFSLCFSFFFTEKAEKKKKEKKRGDEQEGEGNAAFNFK